MDLIQALILGLVEGITEYLPVSSTGHLLIAQHLLGIEESEISKAYAIVIQAGAILAVLGLYRERVGQMLQGVIGRDAAGLRLAVCVIAGFLPAAVLGGLFDKSIEKHLFGVMPVIIAWVVGAAVILLLGTWTQRHRAGKDLLQLRWQGAIVIGLAQCIAMWPGTSRSLVTLLGGLLVGLSLPAAVEFSFLLGLVTLTAATGYKALKLGDGMVAAYGWTALIAGFAMALLSAALAVKWMVAWLTRHGLGLFAWWRLLAAAMALALLRGAA
jgi:undecaprenyl-diphosphatase